MSLDELDKANEYVEILKEFVRLLYHIENSIVNYDHYSIRITTKNDTVCVCYDVADICVCLGPFHSNDHIEPLLSMKTKEQIFFISLDDIIKVSVDEEKQ